MDEPLSVSVPVKWPLRLVNSLFLILPLGWASYWATSSLDQLSYDFLASGGSLFEFGYQGVVIIKGAETQARCLGSLVSFLGLLPVLYGFYQLRVLIVLYGRGCFFTAQHVRAFRKIAWCFIVYALIGIVQTPLMSFVLTMGNPNGDHVISVGFGSDIFIPFMIGFILLPFTHVMAAAQKMAEEQELTI